ncbi:hypothetical protein P154DRAFT_528205 [Amniculicola lignicola CBS 123094]|uniref:Uncharacterized protein n=1 Tax=Amniculicola lignicola CBS 123094 TaxID=1392246 RepID=A0A6A5VTK6_9PLEO|nr:hypothetical protein P154DRAFT_528205 [Amniculicola lignicola CBS 123094]
MAHTTPSEEEVANTLSHLKLSTKVPLKPAAKPKSRPVADSWDEDSGSDTETESANPSSSSTSAKDSLSPINTNASYDSPNPPPPTPASPTPFEFPDNIPALGEQRSRDGSRGGSGTVSPARRPEKTTAVAGRLIAGALGVRAPKRTEEEREFDRAVREKERRRRDEERNREKREKEAAEARKRAVWED